MTEVFVEFKMDTKTGIEKINVKSPFEDKPSAADKINSMLEKTAKSSSAMMRIQDVETGDFHFIHTMKLMDVFIYEAEEA